MLALLPLVEGPGPDGHVEPGPGQVDGDGLADATAGPGDQGHGSAGHHGPPVVPCQLHHKTQSRRVGLMTESTVDQAAPAPITPRQRTVFVVTALGAFMASLDLSIVNVAFPALERLVSP